MKRIYFAGSVGKGDWRNDLAKEADGRIMSNGHREYTAPSGGRFIYGGPFAISDDHGCFHAFGDHGQSGASGCSGVMEGADGGEFIDGVARQDIVSRCFSQIRNSDAVLANITKLDCYATYLEIGYAVALSIPVYVFISECIQKLAAKDYGEYADKDGDELWFIRHCAQTIPTLEIPKELLFRDTKKQYKDYLLSPEWKAISDQKKHEAGNRCQLCNASKKILHTHHRTYDNIFKEKMEDLIVLCETCHSKYHSKG